MFHRARHKGGRGRRVSFIERLFSGSKLLSVQGIKEEEGGGWALSSIYSQAQNYYQYKA